MTTEGTTGTQGRIRVGLIGAGGIAAGAHLPALQAHQDRVEVVAVADLDSERVAALADEWGIPGRYGSAEELLEAEKPDLLVICTPPVAHKEAAIQGLKAGAWVWCEKPPVLTLEEYDEVASHEKPAGPYASYVYQHRFGSAAKTLKKQVAEGTLGRPLVALCNTLWYRSHAYYEVPWRGKWATEGGGPAMGHGIHQIDLLLEILGPWSEITAVADVLDRDVETEDFSSAIVRFDNGAIATVVTSVVSPREVSYLRFDFQDATVEVEHLYGYDNNSWTWTPAPHTSGENAGGTEQAIAAWAPTENTPSSHKQQLGELLDAMEEGERPAASGEEGRRTLEFIAALYQSAETGEKVLRSALKPEGLYYTGMHNPAYAYGNTSIQ